MKKYPYRFTGGISRAQLKDEALVSIFRLCAFSVLVVVVLLLGHLVKNGWGLLSWNFITQAPSEGMTEGGIFPALVGTALVTFITALVALPLGVGAAIFLTEYAKDGWLTRLIRLSIRNLSGVPSVVYGLFGLALFVKLMQFKPGLLTAGLTLGLLILPWAITTAEQAIKSVPPSYQEGALALGCTKWFAIRTVVIPPAMPGILTGLILGLARAAGETAPILFVGASFFVPHLPKSIFDQFMALPYHLYVLSTQHHDIELARPIAYSTGLVLLMLIMFVSGGVILVRSRLRKKYQQW